MTRGCMERDKVEEVSGGSCWSFSGDQLAFAQGIWVSFGVPGSRRWAALSLWRGVIFLKIFRRKLTGKNGKAAARLGYSLESEWGVSFFAIFRHGNACSIVFRGNRLGRDE
ncbi:hypothetical protein SLA2020_228470 [Shorea laevis]